MSSTPPNSTPRVFLDVAPWELRSRNTDWRYARFMLPRLPEYLAEYLPAPALVLQRSRRVTLSANWKAIRTSAGRRLGFPLTVEQIETDRLDAAELKRSGCNVVFSHRGYPVNAGSVPVIWQSSILDPRMMASYTGLSEAELAPERAMRRSLFARAALVQVSTVAEAERLGASYPELQGKFVPIPFFLPDLEAVPAEALERHRSPGRVDLLFVGNQARRKGLDLLLEAFTTLPGAVRARARLTVVSNFDQGGVKAPEAPDITVHRGLPHRETMALMRRCHVLVNAARFESYGFVFPEAMAHGMACVGPDWEVQRELLGESPDGGPDGGRAGVNVPCAAGPLRETLERLIGDDAWRMGLAAAGWKRFRETLTPAVVARQYAALFQRGALLSVSS